MLFFKLKPLLIEAPVAGKVSLVEERRGRDAGIFTKKSLVMKLDGDINTDGKQVFKRYAYANVDLNAGADSIYRIHFTW